MVLHGYQSAWIPAAFLRPSQRKSLVDALFAAALFDAVGFDAGVLDPALFAAELIETAAFGAPFFESSPFFFVSAISFPPESKTNS